MGPANVKVIHAHEFVRARPGGVLDLETSEALLLEIAKGAEGLARTEVLIDTRQGRRPAHAFSGKTAVLCRMARSTGRACSRCSPTARDSTSKRSHLTKSQ